MQRLTIRNSDGSVSRPYNTSAESMLYKLADYEDIGLQPSEVKKLVEAVVVRARKSGHWIPNTNNFTPHRRCSCCGYNKPVAAGEGIKQEPETYCNSCGAKMIEK